VGLDSVHPCLEGEDDSSQRTHQGQYGLFALLVGGMDIFWGRQTLGCHGLYYALLLSASHEGMITLLVCLSSYLHPFYTCECGEWYEEDRGFSPEDVFATVERTIYDLYGHSSVALVENVIRIIRGLAVESSGFEYDVL
jgi:hypothetical protein